MLGLKFGQDVLEGSIAHVIIPLPTIISLLIDYADASRID